MVYYSVNLLRHCLRVLYWNESKMEPEPDFMGRGGQKACQMCTAGLAIAGERYCQACKVKVLWALRLEHFCPLCGREYVRDMVHACPSWVRPPPPKPLSRLELRLKAGFAMIQQAEDGDPR